MPQVAPCETSRLVTKPEEPFQSGAPHPTRSLRLRACEEVECGAHTQHHRRDAIPVYCHPSLLFGAAKADEHNPGTRGYDSIGRPILPQGRQIAEGRALAEYYADPRNR